MHVLGQAADIVMRLDGDRGAAGERDALDHVRVERSLREEVGAADLLGLGVEHVDEQFADGLALLFGVLDAGQRLEEDLTVVDVDERNVVAVAEQRDDLLRLAKPQQAVIDEHASELLTDRLVDENRGDRRVDAAGQAADDAALAHLLADLLDRLVLEGVHGPVAGQGRHLAHEIAQEGRAMRRMHHLEMELGGVEFAVVVADDGDRRVGRGAEHAEGRRQHGDAVAVAHPDRIFFAFAPDALEQRAVGHDLDLGAAELAMVAALDFAAELLRHRLLAVADAEHRHAGLKDRLGRQRGILVEHRRRAAGQDHRLRLHVAEGSLGLLVGHDLAIDLFLAHPPRDQLGHLRAEIDDEDFVVHRRLCRDRGRNRLRSRRLCAIEGARGQGGGRLQLTGPDFGIVR